MFHEDDDSRIGATAPPGFTGTFHSAGVAYDYPEVIDLQQSCVLLQAKFAGQVKHRFAITSTQNVAAQYLVSPSRGIQPRIEIELKGTAWRSGG